MADLEAYDRLLSYSGVAGNDGGIYQATGFEPDGWTDADPDRWESRDGRSRATSVDARKRRWVWRLGDPSARVTRRAAARDADNAGLSAYTTPPDVAGRRPQRFVLCREERPDADPGTPAALSPRARELFADARCRPAAGVPMATRVRRPRAGGVQPPAVFGADVDGTLVAALAVGGDPTSNESAQVAAYAARETAWPDNTVRWLTARARRWPTSRGTMASRPCRARSTRLIGRRRTS